MTKEMYRVLLVEDNPDHALLMGDCLEEAGYQVVKARTGAKAFAALEAEKPDLVVLDYSLPGDDGLAVLEEIRSAEEAMPVVMVTAQGSEQVAVAAMRGGAYDYVVKGGDYLQRLPIVARRAIEAHQLAVERRRAEEALKRRAEQLAALYQISQDITSSLDLDETLQRIADDTRRLTGAIRSRILLVNPQARQVLKHVIFGYPPEAKETYNYEQLEQGISGWVVREKRSALVPDVLADERSAGRSRTASLRYGTKSVAVAPLMVQGEVIGTLTAVNLREDPIFTSEGMAVLEQLAAQAAIAIQNARLYEGEQRRRRIADALRQTATDLASTLDPEAVLELLLGQLRQIVSYDSASVQQLNDDHLEIVACQGFIRPAQVLGLTFPLDPKFPNHRVVTGRTPVLVEDVTREYPHFQHEAQTYSSGHIRSWLGVPLIAKDQVIGMIALGRGEARPYTPEETQLTMAFANQAAIAIENARLYEQARQRAEELQAAYEQLQRAQEALVKAERLAAMSQIGVTVRHEINNPLTAVLGNAQWLLATDQTLSPESQEILKEIETAAIRIRNVVRKLDEIEDRPVPYLGRTMMIDIHSDGEQQTRNS